MGEIDVRSVVYTVPMFRYAILIIFGIVIGDACCEVVDVRIWLFVLTLLVVVSILIDKRHPVVSSVVLLAGVGMVGAFRAGIAKVGEYELSEQIDGSICEMAVVSEPIAHGKVVQFDGLVYDSKDDRNLPGRKIRVSVLRDTITGCYRKIHIGDALQANIDLSPLKDWYRQNPHFDYLRWLRIRGFCGRGFIGIGKWKRLELKCEAIGILEMLKLQVLVFRQKVLEKIEASGVSEEAYAVATAMALGNKSALTPKLHEEYNIVGASHALALSGVHLSIIYIILSSLFGGRRLWNRLLVLALVWLYVVFTGLSISILRAAVMLTVWGILKIVTRRQKALNVLGFTACLMAMVNPRCVFDVGFQMSFAAVFAIVCLMEPFREIMPKRIAYKNKKEQGKMTKKEKIATWLLRKGWFVMTVSLSAQIGTLPLSIYYFGRIPLLFLLTNLVIIPSVLIVVWITLAMALLLAIDIAAGFNGGIVSFALGRLLSGVVWVVQRLLEIIAQLPCASIEGVHVNGIQVVAMYAIVVALVIYVNRRRF